MIDQSTYARETRMLAAMRPEGLESLGNYFKRNNSMTYDAVVDARTILSVLYSEIRGALTGESDLLPRPDLMAYMPWALRQIVRQLSEIDEAQRHGREAPQIVYRLMEDLPKIVDDLGVFHRLIEKSRAADRTNETPILAKGQRDINKYNLSSLNELVIPHRARHLFTPEERTAAHAKFVKEYGGNGEAILLGTLANGTEVLKICSEEAAVAYGSPNWCTSWTAPRKNYFADYSDNLFTLLAPNGQRWQMHFRSAQYNDENDTEIQFDRVLEDNPGVAPLIAPAYYELICEYFAADAASWGTQYPQNEPSKYFCISNLIPLITINDAFRSACIAVIPDFMANMVQKIHTITSEPISEDSFHCMYDFYRAALPIPECAELIPLRDFVALFKFAVEEEDFNFIHEALLLAKKYEPWKNYLSGPQGVALAFEHAVSQDDASKPLVIIEDMLEIPEWRENFPAHHILKVMEAATEVYNQNAFSSLLHSLLSDPELHPYVNVDSIRRVLARPDNADGQKYAHVDACKRYILEILSEHADWAQANGFKGFAVRPEDRPNNQASLDTPRR